MPKFIYVLLFVVSLSIFSCCDDKAIHPDILNTEMDFTIERFEVAFAQSEKSDLPKLKATFPFLFSKYIPDSIWHIRMEDSMQKVIFKEVETEFNTVDAIQKDLKLLLQHLKYYDSFFKTPQVVTIANNVDVKNKVVVNDSLVIIDLLNYLGQDHEFYQNKARFISENMKASQIVPDIANGYAELYARQNSRKTLLDEMIYYGKMLYFKDVMIPHISDADKIGYSEQDIEWAQLNEAQIWSYFVEREMLFDTDSKLFQRFTALAPFSKFYLELDNESPGRLGQYIGWQIVRAYAERSKASILEIMQTEPDKIFTTSKYKP